MKKTVLLSFLFLLPTPAVWAKDLRGFLQNCAWGTLGGATAGVVSLVFVDKPSQSWGNVARGASLGLYAGIAYGLIQMNKESKTEGSADLVIVPQLQQGQLSGVHMMATLVRF